MSAFEITDESRAKARELLDGMDIDRKIGQLLHPAMSPQTGEREIAEQLAGIEPGGVFLFGGTIDEVKKFTVTLQQQLSLPAVISGDLEAGAGKMIIGCTRLPSQMALAAVDDSDVAYQFGRATAIEARSCGIQWVFSPVADISAHPDSPIVNTRSFGSFPDTVKKMAAAMTAGLQENGVCATAKHFPGDGFDYRDQHLITSRNPLEQEEYMAVFGSVYKELIEKGIGSIMVGHIALPSFESKNGGTLIPASISPDIVQGLLREKLGFEGVIISDALDMRGLRSARVKGSYAVEVFKAGVDMLLFADLREDFDALKAAYEKGEISEERINESVLRILTLKTSLSLTEPPQLEKLSEETTTEFRALGRTISERAVTEVRGNRVILPITIKRGGKMLSIQLRSDQAVHADHFENLLEQRGASLMRVSESDAYKLDAIKNPKSYQQIFLIYIFTPNWANNYIRPTGNYLRHLQHFLNRAGNTVIAVSFGSPYHMFDLGEFPVFINAYSNDKPTQEAVLRYLTGELSAQGKSPVSLEEPNLNNYLSGLTHYREYISGNKG